MTLVRSEITEKRPGQGLGSRQAEALADSVVARLATGDPPEPGPGSAEATAAPR